MFKEFKEFAIRGRVWEPCDLACERPPDASDRITAGSRGLFEPFREPFPPALRFARGCAQGGSGGHRLWQLHQLSNQFSDRRVCGFPADPANQPIKDESGTAGRPGNKRVSVLPFVHPG